MKIWLASKWEGIQTSFWFVPTVMVVAAIGLSLTTISLDKAAIADDQATMGSNTAAADKHSKLGALGWTFARGPEGSRALLSTVAGSMMTIASVTFSITIVALQLASAQFGPRLLRNFMRDRGNQLAIGTFIATFTYCLLVLRTVNGTEGEVFVPHISVTVGLGLALVSLGILIYFIHHSAESIQAENVIRGVARDLHRAIERLYPESLGHEPLAVLQGGPTIHLPPDFDAGCRVISAPRSDYLQAIDVERVLRIARDHDLIIALDQRPGKFFFKGNDLARIYPGSRVDEALADAVQESCYFGHRRTLTQDIEFAIDQLVEVAVRALSPGINDPFTAINCVDRLGAALCILAEKFIPSPFRYDEHGKLRVVTDASTIAGIIDAAFNQIRQAARKDEAVTIRLLETIAAVATDTDDPQFRAPLRKHAEKILRGSQEGLEDAADRQDAAERYRAVIAILDQPRVRTRALAGASV